MDHQEAANIGEAVIKLQVEFEEKLNHANINTQTLTPYQLLLAFASYDAIDFLKSIVMLGKNGLGMQADLLVRSMFEMYVNVKFLHDRRQHVERYIEFSSYLRKLRVDDLEEHGAKLYPDTPEGQSERENVISEAKGVSAKHGFKGRFWYPVDPPTFKQMCEEIGSLQDYNTVYRHISAYAHFDVTSLARYDLVTKEGYAEFSCVKSYGTQAIISASDLALTIYGLLDDEHKLRLGDKVDELKAHLKK